jgi:hypothetical protein
MIQAVFDQLSVLAANEVRIMQGLKPTEVDDNNEDGGDDHGDVIPRRLSLLWRGRLCHYRNSPMVVAPAVHMRVKRIIVLDTETTGIQRYERIVTLGAARLKRH